MIQQGIYTGTVWHERTVVKQHNFEYKMLMLTIDLDEIEQHITPTMIKYNQFGLLSIRDRDHFPGSDLSIKENIEQLLPKKIQQKTHRVIMISQLAHFGLAFNPISFFVITDQNANEILGIILEVHNTPWGERCYYPLFDLNKANDQYSTNFKKTLHVSPFLPMDYEYHFSLSSNNSSQIQFTLENWQGKDKHFTASIELNYHELNQHELKKCFVKHLFSPHKTVLAIYWQALKLLIKRVPIYSHPKRERDTDD